MTFYRAKNFQTGQIIQVKFDKWLELDSRIWEKYTVSDTPKSHRVDTFNTSKVYGIDKQNFVIGVGHIGYLFPFPKFENFVYVDVSEICQFHNITF